MSAVTDFILLPHIYTSDKIYWPAEGENVPKCASAF